MLWFKALHLVFMVAWFAGLFYLPRLFVYHAMSEDDISIDRFKVMERKLYFGITTPAGIFTLVFGTWTFYLYGFFVPYLGQLWIHIKLTLIILLVIYHIYCGKLLKNFKHDRNQRSHIWLRWFNEFPVVFLIAIMLLAVLKPF